MRTAELLDPLPDAVLVVDPYGRVAASNAAAEPLLGRDRAALLGMNIESLGPERAPGGHAAPRGTFVEAPHRRAMGSGRDLTILHLTGAEIPVDLALARHPSSEWPVIASQRSATTASADASPSSTRRWRLGSRDSERLAGLGIFAAQLAHEINNPLAATPRVPSSRPTCGPWTARRAKRWTSSTTNRAP